MDVKTLMTQEDFRAKLCAANDLAAVRELFSAEGVELSEKEIMQLILPEGEELNETELEDVSGGGSALNWFRSRLGGRRSFGGGTMGGR